MIRLWNFIRALLREWADERERTRKEQARIQADASERLSRIEKAATIDHEQAEALRAEGESLSETARRLGLAVVLALALAAPAQAQSYQERIAAMSHAELRVYATQAAELAIARGELIERQQATIDDLSGRLTAVSAEIAGIRKDIAKLAPPAKRGKWGSFFAILVRAAPILLGAVSAAK